MFSEVQEFRLAAMETLNRMADVEAALARKAHPADEVSESWMHEHGEMCLREAARAIQRLGRE